MKEDETVATIVKYPDKILDAAVNILGNLTKIIYCLNTKLTP